MLSWLRRRRREKCAAAGHPFAKAHVRRYYAEPTELNAIWPTYSVADVVRVRHESCRCGERQQETEVKRKPLQGLTMSDDKWDTLHEVGRVAADS